METFGSLLPFLIIGGIVALFVIVNKNNKKQDVKIYDYLSGINGFDLTEFVIAGDKSNGIAFDEKNKKICFATFDKRNKHNFSCIYSYRDILSSEIIEDGESFISTSRTSQVGGMLVGGLLLGGVGALVGGLTGKKVNKQKIDRLQLRVVVNDTSNPSFVLNLLQFRTKKRSLLYNQAIDKAKHWHDVISVMIRQADDEDKKNEKAEKQQDTKSQISVADELHKFSDLLKQGLITQEDFNKQKEKLLG